MKYLSYSVSWVKDSFQFLAIDAHTFNNILNTCVHKGIPMRFISIPLYQFVCLSLIYLEGSIRAILNLANNLSIFNTNCLSYKLFGLNFAHLLQTTALCKYLNIFCLEITLSPIHRHSHPILDEIFLCFYLLIHLNKWHAQILCVYLFRTQNPHAAAFHRCAKLLYFVCANSYQC